MNGICKLLQEGRGCELEQYPMGNKFVNKGATYVVVFGGLEEAGWDSERTGVFEFPKLQNVNHVRYAVFHHTYLCVLALKKAQWEYMMRATVKSVG